MGSPFPSATGGVVTFNIRPNAPVQASKAIPHKPWLATNSATYRMMISNVCHSFSAVAHGFNI